MNETEENKAQEQAEPTPDQAQEKSEPDTTQADVADADKGSETSEATVDEPAMAEPDAAEDASPEPQSQSEPAKEKEAKEKDAKAEPVRSKQPSMEDSLNIDEDKNWYVVQAFSGYEASVKRSLLERIERAGLDKDFGEILVPTEEVVEIRGGQKRKSERKFFPGYVLVQMDLNDETWHLVKNVPRVLGFIGGTADRPAPISAKEADAILQRVQDGVDKPRPKVLFDVGEVVRVTDGPFNDFNGVVEEVNFEKNKLLVAVQIFGRSTPVELEFSQVEKA